MAASCNCRLSLPKKRHSLLVLVLWLVSVLPGSSAPAAASRESDVKAVLLFHLTHFVTWPPTAWTNDTAPLVIGILGPDPFLEALDAVTKNEKAGGRIITIRRASTINELTNVHILYVSTGAREPLSKIFDAMKSQPALTVGEASDFIGRGGMMRFRTGSDRKVRLQVDLERARRQGLQVSAQLLRVSEVVGGNPVK